MPSFSAAENRWQLQPKDLRTQIDPVPAAVRASRDQLWMARLAKYKTAEHNGLVLAEAQGLSPLNSEEIPTNKIWVVAQFTNYYVFSLRPEEQQSPEDVMMYTEETFVVSEVIYQPSPNSLKTGDSLAIDTPGGKAIDQVGNVVAWRLNPRQHSPQPGHTYLMALTHDSATGLYTIEKYWDANTGVLIPEQPDEITRRASGTASISGKPLVEASDYIRASLAGRNRGK